jgi:hypothetical protein
MIQALVLGKSLHLWYYTRKEPYMKGSLATKVLVSL